LEKWDFRWPNDTDVERISCTMITAADPPCMAGRQ
jgi:hypothetical protein